MRPSSGSQTKNDANDQGNRQAMMGFKMSKPSSKETLI